MLKWVFGGFAFVSVVSALFLGADVFAFLGEHWLTILVVLIVLYVVVWAAGGSGGDGGGFGGLDGGGD